MVDKEINKRKTADILNDTKEYVDKDADEFTKLAQLCDYYMYSGNFKVLPHNYVQPRIFMPDCTSILRPIIFCCTDRTLCVLPSLLCC